MKQKDEYRIPECFMMNDDSDHSLSLSVTLG